MKDINKITETAEILILLGMLAIVIAAFMINTILGLVILGVSLIIVGTLLLKAVGISLGGR